MNRLVMKIPRRIIPLRIRLISKIFREILISKAQERGKPKDATRITNQRGRKIAEAITVRSFQVKFRDCSTAIVRSFTEKTYRCTKPSYRSSYKQLDKYRSLYDPREPSNVSFEYCFHDRSDHKDELFTKDATTISKVDPKCIANFATSQH